MSTVENFDKVLEEAGPFGRYQLVLFSLILCPITSCAMVNGQYIFNAADLNYRCLVPECEGPAANWTAGPWAAWALPAGSRCVRRAPRPAPAPAPANACSPDLFYNYTQRCDQWLYQTNLTIVAEFQLACQEWKRAVVGMVHNIGKFSSLFIVGIVSDRFGRKTVFVTAASAGAALAVARSFSNSYLLYLLLEFLDGAIDAGVYSTGYILALEMIGPAKRVLAGCVMSCVFAAGQVLLAALAWQWPYWRTLTRIVYTPSFLYITYFFLLDESVRWLLAKGKTEKALSILQRVAAVNGRRLKEDTVQRLLDAPAPAADAPRETVCNQVVHSRILISRVLICSFVWSSISFVYYGLSINSVSLAGNMYVNYILTSLAEIPGYVLAICVLDRFGRKRSIMAALFVCALTLVMLPFVPKNAWGASLALLLAGKAAVSLGIASIYVLTLELFPTRARQSLMNACSTLARAGAIAAPLSPLLLSLSPLAPYLTFGALAGAAALLLLLMPETNHAQLPDTIAQAERISKSSTRRAAQPPAPAAQPPTSASQPPASASQPPAPAPQTPANPEDPENSRANPESGTR